MTIKAILKEVFTLRREKSETLSYYNFNNRQILRLNNKTVLSGRESKELSERRKIADRYATDLYNAETQIDSLLQLVPHIHLTGYIVNPVS